MRSCDVSEAFTSLVNKLGLNVGGTDKRQKVANYTLAELKGPPTVEKIKRYARLSPATQRADVMELGLIANGY
jgi:hypothetical protein